MARPLLVYTLLRVVLFVGCFGLLTLVGMRGLLTVVAALVVSAVASVVLLKPQRDAIAAVAAQRRVDTLAERDRRQARLRDDA